MIVLSGTIVHGEERGSVLGFPTANVHPKHGSSMPPSGVYAAWALLGRVWYRAAVSVGRNVTFGAAQATVEAHILNFHKNVYTRPMTLVFVQRLRPMRRFRSVAALRTAIAADITKTKKILITSY